MGEYFLKKSPVSLRASKALSASILLFVLGISPHAHAMEGGAPASPASAISRITVAVQAVQPTPDGRARISECTGVRIAPDIVVTAAHCLDIAQGPGQVAVFAYDGARAVPPHSLAAAIARHPGYRPGWAQTPGDPETRQAQIATDLAFIRLAAPLPTPPAVAQVAELPAAGTPAIFAGAGSDGGSPPQSGVLKTAPLDALRLTNSNPRLGFGTPHGARICRGDSGGPVGALTTNGFQVWGLTAAILHGQHGCATRAVVIPLNPAGEAYQAMLRAVRK